ncbi:platelet endothelial aggregation receptor 1-like [Haliotis rubra]|uniref:platelet endothelial aggregation receptor 1-like n=1 Tax=Haliotis rubra TaxID=36100 RepID=UPI001EE58D60|nr:platelet endothelial aggregation receptor 1-like [Haliotis rubra]XP_046564997.1 platelet endothelial aggregation receptor 1-like [Haliotis rubra]XP_046564998.1 platelet endothelial aggregation receptor 1-like [Haliotis rubra]
MKGQDISSAMLILSLLSIILGLHVRGDPICPPGTYGDACAKNCSTRCRVYSGTNRIYCDKTSGRCAEGCIQGWYDDKCNRQCSKNCINNICNQQAGECTRGCTDGKKGTFCEIPATEEPHTGKAQEISAAKWAGLGTGFAASVLVFILLLIGALYICRQKICKCDFNIHFISFST